MARYPACEKGRSDPGDYREQEAEAIEGKLRDKDYVVALDIVKAVSTELIAERLTSGRCRVSRSHCHWRPGWIACARFGVGQ